MSSPVEVPAKSAEQTGKPGVRVLLALESELAVKSAVSNTGYAGVEISLSSVAEPFCLSLTSFACSRL